MFKRLSLLLLPLLSDLSTAIPQTTSTTSTSTSSSSTSQQPCNNAASLCDKSYNAVSYLGAHDSPYVANKTNSYTISGNQFFSSTAQLDAGVRLLTAQLHYRNDSDTRDTTLRLCHSSCELYDAGTLVTWLGEIKAWMDANPRDVVTILLVNSVDARATAVGQDFAASGIANYGYAPAQGQSGSWPTLSSMIASNKRLVTFVASLGTPSAQHAYLLDEWTYMFENAYEVTTPSAFSCTPDRPTAQKGSVQAAASSGKLFMMNHFLYEQQAFGIQTPNRDNLNVTNGADATQQGSLGEHAARCKTTYGKAPTFVLVDYFNVGPAMTTVDRLNGVEGQASGRKAVTGAILSQTQDNAARSLRAIRTRDAMVALAVTSILILVMA